MMISLSARLGTGLLVLATLLLAPSSPGQAQSTSIEPGSTLLALADLSADYRLVDSESSSAEQADGGRVQRVVYRRDGTSTGPILVRNTASSWPSEEAARAMFRGLPSLLAGQGFSPTAAAPVGDESGGYTSPDVLDGQVVVYQTVAYRLGSVVQIVTVVGPPDSTSVDEALRLAGLTAGRVALVLGRTSPATEQPDPAGAASDPVAATERAPAPAAGAGVPTTTPSGPPGVLLSAALVDAPDIGSSLRLAGLSGLVALDTSGTLFLSVTDRGPNDEIRSGKERKLTFPEPGYSPSVIKLQLQDGQLRIVERIPLKLRAGFTDPITNSALISGLSISDDEQPWSKLARDRLPLDPNGVDSEGLAYDPRDGGFWICDEYGPSILRVAADGTIMYRLVPRGLGLDAPGEDVRELLPRELAKRKANRGFEGISLSPDGSTLFAIMQSPLSIPDEDAGESSRNIRLLTLDVSDAAAPRLSGMYLYLAEPAERVGGAQDDVKVGDLAALSRTRALVAERDNVAGGRHKMVYAIDLAEATSLIDLKPGRKSFEQMGEGELRQAAIRPLPKSPVADLAAYGYSPEKLEGLAVIDERTVAAVNDNDFGFAGIDAGGQAIPSGIETRVVLVRLEQPLR